MRIAASKIGDEPIAGYVLRKRLGAGGYGEVWLADAPGGLQKAIKLVFGTVDESHAASELKSLERIRKLNHPFLLSLERIEIVDNQVVIVTDLAESSLQDRFEHFRRSGEPGIPRATLLDYLRDTADALDFLSQKHSLQHLDIKPGNLLIVADRIKVGDFGLVKDLHDQNQSLVGGLTPTYSAPEIFDGRPDHRSDQYSLAIVYMEMLTGHLPFSGTTTGELARQHLTQPPVLEALPPADRSAVARALSKNPLDRFASCRALVDQLQKNRGAVVPDVVRNENQAGQASASDLSTSPKNSELICTATAATVGVGHEYYDRIQVDDQLQSVWQAPRCMFVGLGGTGCRSLLKLRRRLADHCDASYTADDHAWIAIDTTPDALCEVTDDRLPFSLDAEHVIQIPIYGPSTYRDLDPSRFAPLSRRWLYNIPKSQTTEGVRPLATLSLLHHYEEVTQRIRETANQLVIDHNSSDSRDEPLRVYLLASVHGGTGSGLLCELGSLIQQVFHDLGVKNVRVIAAITVATTTNNSHANLPSAAGLSCLSELTFEMSGTQEIEPLLRDSASTAHIERPFDWVTLIEGGLHGDESDAETAIAEVAQFVFADSQTVLSTLMAEDRISGAGNMRWLRAGRAQPVMNATSINEVSLARWCCVQSLRQAAVYMLGSAAVTHADDASPSDEFELPPTVSGDVPLTNQASDDFTHRLLKDLGVIDSNLKLNDITASAEGDRLLSKWARRLSNSQQHIEMQVRADIETWTDSISEVIKMRVYNWRQVEQIQLNAIEGLLDYCDKGIPELTNLFTPFSHMLGPPEQMQEMAVAYLKRFAGTCLRVLELYRQEGKQLAARLKGWYDTISAERAQHQDAGNFTVASLPQQVQMVANRVTSVLDTTLTKEMQQVLDHALKKLQLSNKKRQSSLVVEHVNLRYIISSATDLMQRMSREAGIDLADSACAQDDAGDSISLEQFKHFCPSLAKHGGRSHRMLFAPQEQLNGLQGVLRRKGLTATTTCIPVSESVGALAISEANQINLAQVVSTIWRPSSATMQLAERLRTRVDVDWDSVGRLLEASIPDALATAAPVIAAVPQTSMSPA